MSRTPPEAQARTGGAPLALTMGDAVGVGPECIARLFSRGDLRDVVVIGEREAMRRACALLGPAAPPVALIDSPQDLAQVPAGCVPVIEPAGLPNGLGTLPWGEVHAHCGSAAARCVEHAVRLVQQGQVSGIVTAPLHKAALSAAGIDFPGHTEMLQALAAGPRAGPGQMPQVRMMLANDELRVVLVTIHLALRQAIEAIDRQAVLDTIRIAHRSARLWGAGQPRIAVAGLNPHAGEGGLFGHEEQAFIAPAVRAARDEGIDAQGPFAPDTVFMRARNAPGHPGEFDLVVAMTHDHGLIPVKYLGVERGVNVTLGLPFVRTSPDHGTAFDIAGRGRADASSLGAALQAARAMAAVRATQPLG